MDYHTERMANIGYGVAPRRRRQLMEDPRFSCVASGFFYPPLVGWWSVTEALDEDALTAHKRGGRATDQPARRERVLGPLRLPPPLSVVCLRFTFRVKVTA